jgi:polysaccharide export outer membrane protein
MTKKDLRSFGQVLVLAAFAWLSTHAQTTIMAPPVSSDSCESTDCLESGTKIESAGGARTVPARVWQMNDDDTDQYLGKAGQGRRAPGQDQGKPFSNRYSSEAEKETEFQELVHRSTGKHLPIFGRNFFLAQPRLPTFKDRAPVPADYALAAGDHMLIHIWGQTDFSSIVIVDRNGQIFLPKIGMIAVMGVRYDQLHDFLKSAISRRFKNFDISVSLGQMRLLPILITGHARRPGRYLANSLSTLVSALAYAGGPAVDGSMRHIQLRREGKIIDEFDLYDLLLHGDSSKDAVLASGDVVYIPPVGPMVAVAGSVNQPAIYELRGPTTVAEQIETAGGLNSAADSTRATLERMNNGIERKVEGLVLDQTGKTRALQDGDLLRVFPVSPRFENAVTLRGNVARPGRYPWKAGMHIQDLIPSREALITSEYWLQQDALGKSPSGWIDRPKADERHTRSMSGVGKDNNNLEPMLPAGTLPPDAETGREMESAETQGSSGVSPMAGLYGEATVVSPVNMRSLAEINWEYAVVQRLNSADLTTRLLSFNLSHALQDSNSPDNLALEPGDVVTIFSQRDLAVPEENRTKFVWVAGEVKAAGIYRAEPGETLRQIVARAGGLTPQAYLYAATFQRESTRIEQQKEMQRMLDEMDKELRSKAASATAGTNPEERLAQQQELEAEKSVIEKLRQTPSTGRVVLDLNPTDTEIGSLPGLPLEDGDRITIPTRPATVEVVGAVYNQNAFLYREGKRMNDYIGQSGGGTRDADAGRMFVVRADGSVLSKQMHRSLWAGNLESLKLMPGDTIVVPERIRTSNLLRGIRDWSQVFSQFALGAAAIRVISP